MQRFFYKVWISPRIKILSKKVDVIFMWHHIFQSYALRNKSWNFQMKVSKTHETQSTNKDVLMMILKVLFCHIKYWYDCFMSLNWWHFCEMLSHVNVKTQFLSHMIKKKVLVPYHLYSCINPAWSCPGAAIPAKLSSNVDTDRGSQMETTCKCKMDVWLSWLQW